MDVLARRMAAICIAMFWADSIAWSLELPPEALLNLKSQEYRKRELAESDLLAWGRMQPENSMIELLGQSQMADDPEVRERCLDILHDLVTDEFLKEGEGFIGIALKDEISNVPGDATPRSVIRVTEVRAETPGQHAGIQVNDLIVGLDGQVWHGVNASPLFQEKIRIKRPKTQVGIKILRNGGLIDLKVNLGRRPLIADNPFFNGRYIDPEASEQAAKDAYFQRWLLSHKKLQK